MKMKATTVSAVLMTVLMVVLVSAPIVAKAQTPAGDTLIVGVQNDTPNLHPWDTATNSVWKSFLWRQWVYEGLFGLSPDGSIYPVLAESYDYNPADPLNVTVHIRQGITFTDGAPLNATDVVFTYQILAFNSQRSDTVLKSVVWQDPPTWPRWNATTTAWGAANPTHVGVTLIDAYTVKFQLRQAYSMFFFGTLTEMIMPVHIWKDHLVKVSLAVFKLPDGTAISQGTEFDFDRNFGSSQTDVQATIGTGPWYLVQWTRSVSVTLRIYEGYWGKTEGLTWKGQQWPFYPTNLRRMEFRIYLSLDVAILALKSGEVHVVPWNLPTGFYNDLRRDPRMGFSVAASDGFFYIAFNMRQAPFNDVNFRKAVGYVIDKDFIVDRLLAGFGIKGQMPISPINPAYINSSALAPPFDRNQAINILNTAGYTDRDGDGWRDYPDGRPLKKTILTPAKDYDPVRADAGIMISNNLKSIGLNIDSAPTAFDAIVSAVFVAVQFDMYILGWVSLGPFPELYLADFFACASDVLLGVGSNTPGFCNAGFEQKLNILDTSMDDAARLQAAKDAQGILARELPYDVLYITRQIEGYRSDIWGGWVDVNGEIFNGFSIGVLGPPGEQRAPTGPLTISLNMPGQGIAGTTSHFQVYAVQAGLPAANVDLNITATTGEWVTATTGADGYADVEFQLPYSFGLINFIVTAVKGTDTGGDMASMNIILPNDVAQLRLTTGTPVIVPGGTATITATVTDRAGNPISGAPVEMIPELVLGTVAPGTNATDTSGVARFAYTAPSGTLIPNRNHYDYVKATVDVPAKPKLPETKTQTLVMGVQNSAYDWYVLNISSVSAYVVDNDPVSPIPATSTVTVNVKKQDGTAVGSEYVTVTLSNATAMSVDAARKQTNAAGDVTFTFTALTAVSTPVSVLFNVSRAFQAKSGLSLLVTDSVTAAYATFMSLTSKFADPNSRIDMTVTVYNEVGNPASGTEVDIFVPYSDVGNPVNLTDWVKWTTIPNVGTVFSDTTNVGGTVTTSIKMRSFPADSITVFETGIAGFGPQGAFILGSPSSTYFYQNVIQKRNKLIAVESWSIAPLYLNPDNPTGTLTITFRDLSGAAAGASISAYRGKGDLRPNKGATKIGAYITDASGQITVPWTEPARVVDTSMAFTAITTSNGSYALGGQVGGVPFEQYFPYLLSDPDILVPTGLPASTIVRVGTAQTYNILVKDYFNTTVQDALIIGKIAESSGNVTARTDGTGRATIQMVPGTYSTVPRNARVWEVTLEIKKGNLTTTIQFGTMVGVGEFAYSNLVVPTSASVGTATTISVSVNNTGPVRDNEVVTLNVDGTPYSSKQVTIDPGQTVTVSFTWVPTDTASHTFAVKTLSGTLAATGAGPAGAGIDTAVAVGLAIVLLIVGVIVGFFIGKKMKPPAPSVAEPEVEAPKEEPAPEEKKI